MSGTIYSKPITFAVMATVTVLVGTVVTMAYPLLRPDMHGKEIPGLRPLPALELAGRDIYQREGCVNCHTQTVRPLKSEVVRYGGSRAPVKSEQYSLAGEFVYDHPFLWGSKRTGPDLAFEGWIKPSAAWQKEHLQDPQKLVPRSNMPRYAFLDREPVDGAAVQASMRALRTVGVPYTDADVAAAPQAVQGKTHMDALVAYVLSLGRAVNRGGAGGGGVDLATRTGTTFVFADAGKVKGAIQIASACSGLAGLLTMGIVAACVAAVTRGRQLWDANGCGACHGDEAHGQPGVAPNLLDDEFGGEKGDLPDAAYFAMIKGGSDVKASLGRPGVKEGGMQAFGGELKDEDIWDRGREEGSGRAPRRRAGEGREVGGSHGLQARDRRPLLLRGEGDLPQAPPRLGAAVLGAHRLRGVLPVGLLAGAGRLAAGAGRGGRRRERRRQHRHDHPLHRHPHCRRHRPRPGAAVAEGAPRRVTAWPRSSPT